MIFNLIKNLLFRAPAPLAPCAKSPDDPARVSENETTQCIDTEAPWIGVDLDGTLAHWDNASSLDRIGKPIPSMLSFVHRMVENGLRVKIFTARAGEPSQLPLIRRWLHSNGLPSLEITNVKDYGMQRLYDDRSIQVEKNTGRIISDLN